MDFRLATPSDAPFIEHLLAEFYEKHKDLYGVGYDPTSCLLSVIDVIQNGVVIVGPTSTAGAIFQPFFSNHSEKVAFCAFWYFRNAREIKIFDILCKAAKHMGATRLTAASHFPHHRIMKYYKKRGLAPLEAHSMLKL